MSLELLEEYIQTGNASGITELLKANASLAKLKTSHQISPLMLSCYYKKPDISKIILTYSGEPDIYEAAAVGKFDSIANIIYQHPEYVNTFSEDGFTPLGLACYFGNYEIARYLLLKGAEVNTPSKNGYNVFPLHSAVAENRADLTKILLEAGADVNIAQASGITPLHSAAQNGNIEILISLLEAGANVNVRMEGGKTPADLDNEKGFSDIAGILSE